MSKGNRFKLVLVPAVSAALLALGCNDSGAPAGGTVCVDANGRRVSDDRCTGANRSFYHWYHASGGSSGAAAGSRAHGESRVSRGGFGSSAHSFIHVGG